jgi:hypothetical protein
MARKAAGFAGGFPADARQLLIVICFRQELAE